MAKESEFDLARMIDLQENGPIVDVAINGVDARALVDTGAKVSCISPERATRLSLVKIGDDWYDERNRIQSPIFECRLVIGQHDLGIQELRAFPISNRKLFEVIIGRDVLAGLTFTYNGCAGTFSLE